MNANQNSLRRRRWLLAAIFAVVGIIVITIFVVPIFQPQATALTIATKISNGLLEFVYLQPLGATGGTSPYNWTITSGILPSGLELTNDRAVDSSGNPAGQPFGLISGYPTETGNFPFTLQVIDSAGNTASRSFSITVDAPPTNRICADGSVPSSPCPPVHTISVESGDNQIGLVGNKLPQPLKIKVNPVGEGIGIAWKITQGDGKFRSWTTTTDANGVAQAEYILAKSPGVNGIQARIMEGNATDPAKLPPTVTFTAEGRLPTIEKQNDNQEKTLGSSLPKPIIVTVKDPNNNSVEGVKVKFSAIQPQNLNITPPKVIPGKDAIGTFTNQSGIASAVVGMPVHDEGGAGNYTIRAELPEFGISKDFTTTFTEPEKVVIVGDPLVSSIPAQQTSITVFVNEPNPNPPPQCLSVPVTFAIVLGDGSLSANTVNTDPDTCTATVTYTFGSNAEPDIVSATAMGETVYFAVNSPNVEVQAVDFVNSVKIKKNKNTPVLDAPEWKKTYQADDRNEPAAYKLSSSVKIKVKLLADATVSSADVEAVVNDGDALQKVIKKNVSFTSIGMPVEVEFDVDGATVASISKKDVKWQWKISNMNGMGSNLKNSAASGAHTIYTLLGTTPQAPMNEPWTDVLDHSTSSSWAGGSVTADAAATAIVKKVYHSVGLEYDTVQGHSSFGSVEKFHLTEFLNHLRNGGIKTCGCFDTGHIVVAFGNSLGADMKARFIYGGDGTVKAHLSKRGTVTIAKNVPLWLNQPLNIIDPIGEEAKITNAPYCLPTAESILDDSRTFRFSNHMYAVMGTKVYDANLMVDAERVPDGIGTNEFRTPLNPPLNLVLPTGMEVQEYKDRLFDDAPIKTVEDHDENRDCKIDASDDLDYDGVPEKIEQSGSEVIRELSFSVD